MIFTPLSKVDEPATDNEIDDIEEIDEVDEVGNLSQALEMPPIHIDLTPSACGERLDKVIAKLIPQFSRSRMQQWIAGGYVSVDGKIVRHKMTALGDEHIVVMPQAAPEDVAYKPEKMALAIVHEDAAIIVINKPAGLVVHPAAGNWSGTLLNGLLHHYPQISGVPRAGIVHRLDKDTSGLMVVAKNLVAHTDLVRQLQARTVKREYFALVWGTPHLSGTVDAAMGRHPRDRIKMAVLENLSAKPAVTHYERLASGLLDGRPVSLIRCRLETGRTHQIRVHMLSLGFPLVGDVLYGKQHLAFAFGRQALHACRLGLIHPQSQACMEWSVSLPVDFAALLVRAGISGID